MKFTTALRSGSVRWAGPAALLLASLYYLTGDVTPLDEYHHWAPAIVSAPLMVLYALAYALSAALGVWESGRLRNTRVWHLLPTRSRYRVAANVLLPVVILAWLVLLLPPAVSLARSGTAPSLDSLRLPAMGMVLCVAHAVIGFALGAFLPRIIATPVIAVADWITVAFTRATHPYWLRHVSGQFADIGFGEVPRLVSVAAPVLLAGGIAAGLLVMWLPFGPRVVRGILALTVAVAGVLGAHHLTQDWPHTPPLATGQAAVVCTGERPRVCMPQVTAGYLPQAQRKAATVLSKLRKAGISGANPARIDDPLIGAASPGQGKRVWRLSLVSATQHHEVGYQVMVRALPFRCPEVVPAVRAHSVWLWAATRTGEVDAYRNHRKREAVTPETRQTEDSVHTQVQKVLGQSPAEQSRWISRSLNTCPGTGA